MSLLRRLFGDAAQVRRGAHTTLHIEDNTLIYAIGDVHGRADLLMRLLEMIAEDIACSAEKATIKVIFLGDYIDRGVDTRKVLSILQRMQDYPQIVTRFLMGNHEAAMLGFLDDPVRGAGWLSMGAFQTFESYGVPPPPLHGGDAEALVAARDHLRAALRQDEAFLRWGLVRWTRSGDTVFVHAAVDPESPIEAQSDDALLWGRAPGFVEARGLPGVTIIHGHFISEIPDERAWRIGIDTGAYFSGKLTALRISDNTHSFIVT